MSNNENFTPSYMQIQNYISEKIQGGEYPVGSKIPSETELARMFSVSRITANKAVKEMSVMGILERVRGKGTFVCASPGVSTASKAFVSAAKLNITGSRCHQLLQFRVCDAYTELTGKNKFTAGEPLYEIILANKNGEITESLDFMYIPCSLIPDITPTLNSLCTHFAFDYLKAQPNINPKFLKIFVNTPMYRFLEPVAGYLETHETLQIWNTDVYDANMSLLCAVFTTYPNTSQDVPLFTFSL